MHGIIGKNIQGGMAMGGFFWIAALPEEFSQ
jgi:hypothetical protein